MVKQVILCSSPMWAVCQVAVKLPWKNYVCCIKRLDTDEVLMILPAFDEMILQPFLLHPVHPNVSHCWHSGVGCNGGDIRSLAGGFSLSWFTAGILPEEYK